MKKIIALLLAVTLIIAAFVAGAYHAFLHILRHAEFYVVDDMVIIDVFDDYNEVEVTGGWDEFLDKHAKG